MAAARYVPLVGLLVMAAACGQAGSPDTEICPDPHGQPVQDQVAACKRSAGTYKEFSNTCVDSCESRMQGFCGDAFASGCDCGVGRCFNGWECVPDRCAHHYGEQATSRARAVAVEAEAKRIERRIARLRNASLQAELAELERFKVWLRQQYPDHRIGVRTAAGLTTDHTQWDQFPNGELIVEFVIDLRDQPVGFDWTPKDNHNIVVLWEP